MATPAERGDPRLAHLTVRSGCLVALVAFAVCTLTLLAGSATFGGYDPVRVRSIVGIALGQHGASVRIPREALTCTDTAPERAADLCSVSLDGAELTVDVVYRERGHLSFGRCTATYKETVAECWATWYALTGGPPFYAFIPTVEPGEPHLTTQWLGISRVEQYAAPHIEMSDASLAAIRREYPLANLLDREWTMMISAVALLATVTVFVLALLLPTLPLVQRWTGRPRPIVRSTLLPAIAWSAVVLVVTLIGLMLLAMRAGLVD
jgi:hypothetical protein